MSSSKTMIVYATLRPSGIPIPFAKSRAWSDRLENFGITQSNTSFK
ncbi:hypothetical protein [Anabaena sp. CCY 0017]